MFDYLVIGELDDAIRPDDHVLSPLSLSTGHRLSLALSRSLSGLLERRVHVTVRPLVPRLGYPCPVLGLRIQGSQGSGGSGFKVWAFGV